MPQGLIKSRADAGTPLQVGGRALTAAHEQIAGILRSRLGQNHAELLAIPKPDADGGIAWSTNLTGPVLPAAQLPEDERTKLQQRAERFLSEIRGLAQQLRGEGPASTLVAQMLEQAARQPPGDWLYSVGGRPVMVMWGHAAAGASAPPVAPVAAAAAAAAPAAMPAAAAEPGAPVPPVPAAAAAAATPGRPWIRWLLWALLLLLLLALLFWGWKRCSEMPVADAGLDEQIAQAEARNKALEDELSNKRGAPPPMQCVPDPVPPAASAPEPIASAPEPEPPASQPPPNPREDLKRRIADAGKDCKKLAAMLKDEPLLKGSGAEASALKEQMIGTMAKNCRDEAIREAKKMCPGQRPKELAPDMAIVFDASGSMDFSVDVSDAQIKQQAGQAAAEALMRQFGLGGLGGGALDRFKREPKRITVAKRAALGVAQRLPSDMNTGLVLVEQCPNARSVGMYGPGQRGSLIGQIQGIEPRGGTPLADGIAKGGALVDGVTKDSTLVIISDGVESCGRDPCAVATALKRAKPRLKINVVDITGTGAGNCAAQITGGRVFTARNAAEVVEQMNRATQDAMAPANCKP
ncbi:MAG: hypothetical protein KF788_05705 [Piscinibacter sp.]|nr:hypothetical protein [Piscinibacter sp.]